MKKNVEVYGLGGESLLGPYGSIESYWAALGSGADGLACMVSLSSDGRPICGPGADAGDKFRPPALDDILRHFSRRTQLILIVPDRDKPKLTDDIAAATVNIFRDFGVTDRVTIVAPEPACRQLAATGENLNLFLDIGADTTDVMSRIPTDLPIKGIAVNAGALASTATLAGITHECLVVFPDPRTGPTPDQCAAIRTLPNLRGVVTGAVDHTVTMLRPPALVLKDDFAGEKIDLRVWDVGYSHENRETTIYQKDGLIVQIEEGKKYSGAGTVTMCPIHGDFDAQVRFNVTNPCQGTTFEMAAITIDPRGHSDPSKPLEVSLVFDVHGAPPYASSERDEADGFRIGWNNSFTVTSTEKVPTATGDVDWVTSSVNMYNRYGHDYGIGRAGNSNGHLRLVRHGQVFASFFKDKNNPDWVCSGAALVPNLGADIHIRLAAKHWRKDGAVPPPNTVTFNDFKLYQR